MKKVLASFVLLSLLMVASIGYGRPSGKDISQYSTITLNGTADVLIDSTLNAALLKGKRVHIAGVYAFYDNAANTNQFNVQIVSGETALRVSNSQRVFRYATAMTSGGYASFTWEPNIIAPADSALYFVINAASSDSLYMTVTYTLLN